MPANSNSSENLRIARISILTNHAKARMATRGLSADAIDAALTFGRVVYVRGADICAIGRKEIAWYAKDGIDLSAYDGVQVVTTTDGIILTVYRNRSFNGLRGRCAHRRRTYPHAA